MTVLEMANLHISTFFYLSANLLGEKVNVYQWINIDLQF